ncbi:MAG: Smr/MutS family protein, partial [Paramuribaculum sp.]|nr:Smr/MutS family protein [Paramuribaculum sp.]
SREPLDVQKLVESVQEPKPVDKKKKWKRPVIKNTEYLPGGDGIIEVDLHIDELVDTTAGLSSADMLNLQVDEFRKVMDANLTNPGQKIVFIHGKGDGVLRQALMKELNHRYKGKVEVQDASFREYGFGATQITIR